MAEKKKRQANFELLRIIAMMMVIVLHYIVKGQVSSKLSVDGSLTNHIWWLLQGFCNVAVNVYVLISGYFLIDAKWRVSKLIRLVCQVVFYSVVVGVVMYAFRGLLGGFYSVAGADANFKLSTWLNIMLPIENEHYWFATAYVVMYMLSPALAIAVKQLPKKELQVMIVALLYFFCVPKSINPYQIPTDSYGYDFGWFICLFLIAGYIKMYGIKLFESKTRAFLLYILGTVANFGICAITGAICRHTGKLEYYMDMTYAYNYVLVLFSSVALFYAFTYVEIKSASFANTVCTIAPLTFGVYLLHENVGIRLIWPYLLGRAHINNFILLLLHMIACVIIVFVVGCIVEFLRRQLFRMIEGLFTNKKTD